MTILTEIVAQLPDNNAEQITPAILRGVLNDMVTDYAAVATAAAATVTKASIGLGIVPNVDATNASNLASGTVPLARLAGAGKVIVIYADGQSNISNKASFAWSCNPNVKVWNNVQDSVNTGTAFVAVDQTTIGIAEKFASDIADANPTSLVYLIKNGYLNQGIAQWLVGAGAPDMYANGTSNVSAALTAIGASTINIYLRWQGEHDASTWNASYVANFATMMTRYFGNSWFQQETPCVIMGVSPQANTGDVHYDYMNNFLRAIAAVDPDKRKFVYTPSLAGGTYWNIAGGAPLHMTAQGYLSAGAMAATALLCGTSRNSDNDPVTGALTAGNPLFTSAPRGVSLNTSGIPIAPPSGTVDHLVGADGGGTNYIGDNFGGFGIQFAGRAASGTMLNPTALVADSIICGIAAQTFDGTGANFTGVLGAFRFLSYGLQSGTNHGTYALLYCTPNNSTVVQQVARWDTSGELVTGFIKSNAPTSGIGYATGAGGTVAQSTSKSTGVTINKASGAVTMNAAALAASAKVSFVVTNSAVAATDTPIVAVASGGTANAYRAEVTAVAAGSFTVTIENITAGSLSESPVINFAIIKGVNS